MRLVRPTQPTHCFEGSSFPLHPDSLDIVLYFVKCIITNSTHTVNIIAFYQTLRISRDSRKLLKWSLPACTGNKP